MTEERPLTNRLVAYVRSRHPRSMQGITEAQALAPSRFSDFSETFLGWAVAAYGDEIVERMVDAFVSFSNDVNFAQARYEVVRHYDHKSYAECQASVYSQQDTMHEYLKGIYLTNFLWAHHLDLSILFDDRFIPLIPDGAQIVEIAPGHGGWGLWALQRTSHSYLRGFDISPSAVEMATRLSVGAGFSSRARYELRDGLALGDVREEADICICSFLIEHLEEPSRLLAVIGGLLKPGCRAFLTGALTAAQVDHIYEFRFESELVSLAETNGLRVSDMRSVGPLRTLPHASFLPRSIALILQKRKHEYW